MKEMYVKPLVEKIIFDNADIITDSVDSDALIPQQNSNQGCTQPNASGKNHGNEKKCTIY